MKLCTSQRSKWKTYQVDSREEGKSYEDQWPKPQKECSSKRKQKSSPWNQTLRRDIQTVMPITPNTLEQAGKENSNLQSLIC